MRFPLEPRHRKGIGEASMPTGEAFDLVDELVAVFMEQVFKRTHADRSAVIAGRRGFDDCDDEPKRTPPCSTARSTVSWAA